MAEPVEPYEPIPEPMPDYEPIEMEPMDMPIDSEF